MVTEHKGTWEKMGKRMGRKKWNMRKVTGTDGVGPSEQNRGTKTFEWRKKVFLKEYGCFSVDQQLFLDSLQYSEE